MEPPPVPEPKLSHDVDAMNTDEAAIQPVIRQEDTQEATQEDTQPDDSQQEESQTILREKNWGLLVPCGKGKKRAYLGRDHHVFAVGRAVLSHIQLTGPKVSNNHCEIRWDGKNSRDALVTVHDLSTNGTFINGEKIGRGRSRILHDGNEIAFGSTIASDANDDFRFMFRLLTGAAVVGLHAEYDVAHQLGQGSFASVHSAVHRATGTLYAIKIINLEKVKPGWKQEVDENGVEKNPFQREIDVMESLTHPNICKLREVFIEPAILALVLEYVPGGDLLDYILKNNGVSEEQARDIVLQTCEALAYCHGRGITHRDLKPENILLTNDNPPMIKVADFGLAKVVDSQTMLRTMCGTPSYLAPEVVTQVNGSGYDNAVDSWSMGVIVFSMLTNTTPFNEDENIQDIRQRIVERTIAWEAIYEHDPPFTAPCVDFVTKLLEREPSIRLTLKNALAHPWLKGHEPVYLRTLRPDNSVFILRNTILDTIWGRPTAATAPLVADVSMSDVGDLLEPPSTIGRPTVGPEPSQASSSGTSNIPGAYPKARSGNGNGNGPSTPRRENSQLVRRADVLVRANDEDVPLPAPPEEMVQREERRRAGGGANSNGNGNGRSRATGQRQVDADADMADASNVAVGSKRRTARPPSEDARPSRKRRSPRDNSPMDDGEESPAPRRSTRQRKAT